MASVSKVVGVGTVLTFLWKEGKIELDNSIRDYLPEVDYPDITVRQLLTHTTDLDPYIPNRDQLSADQLKDAMFLFESSREESLSLLGCALSLTRFSLRILF